MAKKIYKSAKGKPVDLDAIRAKNERTIAVGKNVNARGDILGPGGKIVKTRAERNKEIYSNPINVPDEDPTFNPNQTKPKR